MANTSPRRRPNLRPYLSAVFIVTAALVAAAVLATPRNGAVSRFGLLVGVIVLGVAGAVVGRRDPTRWATVLVGSALGAAIVGGWVILVDPPQDPLSAVRSWLSAGVVFGVVVGAMFAGPGYLFGRASRADDGPATEGWEIGPGTEVAGPPRSTPSVRAYAGAGCLI